jgi:hypothetical protein
MKLWFEAILEKSDAPKKCAECENYVGYVQIESHIFCEFELRGGGLPHPDELHPEPTGRYLCPCCAAKILR